MVEARFLARFHGRTADNYRTALARWHAWCVQNDTDPLHARHHHVEAWSVHLSVNGRGPNTIRTLLSLVAGFYRWAHEEELVAADPLAFVRRPPTPRRSDRAYLAREDLAVFLAHVREHEPAAMSAAVHLFALNGSRPAETFRLDVPDLGRHGAYTTVHFRHRKAHAADRVTVSAPTADALAHATAGRTWGLLLLDPKDADTSEAASEQRSSPPSNAQESPMSRPTDYESASSPWPSTPASLNAT